MPDNVIGKIPDFDPDGSLIQGTEGTGTEEVKETAVEETAEEKETPAELPAESAESIEEAEQKPAPTPEVASEDTGKQELERAVQGLQDERSKLLKEISALKGQRREIKQEQLIAVQQKIDALEGVNPEDVSLIEKVLQAKGYVRKDEVQKELYESVKNEELAKFLEKYPEYKPENDPNDLNWGGLQRELGLYRMPENPRQIREILERAHQAIANSLRRTSDRNFSAQKRAIKTASVGAGGVQRSSSGNKMLSPEQRRLYEDGGWSEEEIAEIEKSL